MAPRYPGQAAATLRQRAQNIDPNSKQYQNIQNRLQGIRERRQTPISTQPYPPNPYELEQAKAPASDTMSADIAHNTAQQTMPYQGSPQEYDQYGNPAGVQAPSGPPMGGGYTGGYNMSEGFQGYQPPGGPSAMESIAQDAANQGYQSPGAAPMQPPMLPPPNVPAAANYTGVASVLRNQLANVDRNSQQGQYLRGRLQNIRDIRQKYPLGGNYKYGGGGY